MSSPDPEELHRVLTLARAAWPDVELAPELFSTWISERTADGQRLSQLRTDDLFLACACSVGEPRALRYFEEQVLVHVDIVLRRMAMTAATIDETKQVLRRRFFVHEGGALPRIVEYSGRGLLQGWVRVAAVRAAMRVVHRPKAQVEVDSSTIRAVASPGVDLEVDYLKRRSASEFEEALREAFAGLTSRERNILRYYYGERLTIDAIGVVYGVHRATSARWVRQAVDTLVASTRGIMTIRFRLTTSEVSSMMHMIESGVDVALRGVLEGSPSVDGDEGE